MGSFFCHISLRFSLSNDCLSENSAASGTEISSSGSMCSQDAGEGDALLHARNLEQFTRHPVLLLKGGYKHFSACYHFLKSQKTLWMPQVCRRR
ncbi:hypothetical protein Nmel_016580 [Mimus melanotis]